VFIFGNELYLNMLLTTNINIDYDKIRNEFTIIIKNII